MFISLQIQDLNLTKKSSQSWLDYIIIIHLSLHNLLPIQEMNCYHAAFFISSFAFSSGFSLKGLEIFFSRFASLLNCDNLVEVPIFQAANTQDTSHMISACLLNRYAPRYALATLNWRASSPANTNRTSLLSIMSVCS